MDERTKEIVTHLRELAEGKRKPLDVRGGICDELEWVFHIPLSKATEMILGWKYHSGDILYPVPATNNRYDARMQYEMTMNLWIRKQGWLRRDLCGYVADKIMMTDDTRCPALWREDD